MDTKIEVTGTLSYIGEVETLSKGFTKRTVVLAEQRGQYTDTVAFTLTRDRTGLVTNGMLNRRVTVAGWVRSRNWRNPNTGRVSWFTEVEAVSVKPADAEVHEPAAPQAGEPAAEVPDDCPF